MKAKVNFDGRWLSEIDVDSYKYPVNERIKRSLKTFFIFFGAALLSVLIPVLHFFFSSLIFNTFCAFILS